MSKKEKETSLTAESVEKAVDEKVEEATAQTVDAVEDTAAETVNAVEEIAADTVEEVAPKQQYVARPVIKQKKQKKARFSYERKKGLYGYGFLAIWIVGALYFFLIPVVMSLYYSFNDVSLNNSTNELNIVWCGMKNFVNAFTSHPKYSEMLVASLLEVVEKVPVILVFSLFAAVLINQKFRGRTIVRAIFFLPVLIATGPVMSVINGEMVAASGANSADQFSSLFQTDLVDSFLEFIGIYGISETMTNTITTITSDVLNLAWNSGVQILIFLAALQTIPTSAREAANMEGATAWEFFWKITFPYVSPMILVNIIYTVVDCFTASSNKVMQIVLQKSSAWEFGYSAAMAWIYFGIILVSLGIITVVLSKLIHYEVD